ncbi:hypothetical protein B0H19DRAFT_1259109 [Mycena capillaripes]|nr:hypothetical protein B0H19DRAFT_1259109 [Mycena capillaripes]
MSSVQFPRSAVDSAFQPSTLVVGQFLIYVQSTTPGFSSTNNQLTMFFNLAALSLITALVGYAQAAPHRLARAQAASTVTVTDVLIKPITTTAIVTVTETSVLLQPAATQTAAAADDTDDNDLSEDQKIALQIANTPQEDFPDASDFAT